jgi:penicillin amidase
MKILKYVFIGLCVAAVAAVIFFQVFFRLPLPDYSGTQEIEGLTSDVEVRFGHYGIPHIFARNDQDLFFAQGYITARERMFQMDLSRRAGRGELSSLLGAATVSADKFLKTVGFYRSATAEYHRLPGPYKDMIVAYTRGVNAYIKSVKHLPREYVLLGAEPEPWVPEDTMVCGILIAYNLTRSKKTDLIFYQIGKEAGEEVLDNIIPAFPHFAPTVSQKNRNQPPTKMAQLVSSGFAPRAPRDSAPKPDMHYVPDEIAASNWMIFSGSRTNTGKPLFTGSPDLEPKIPALFYMIHLKSDNYDVIGGSLPGIPGVNVLGFNGKIAWCTVNGRVDELDYFMEKINPENPDQYLTEDGYKDFEIVTEELKIKTKAGLKTEKLKVKISRHGPIISDVMPSAPPDTAMMWVGMKPSGIFEGFMDLNRASNFDEFRRALKQVKTPTLNIGYADIEGNIGYQYIASPPVRKKGNGVLPVPGWSGEYDWIGNVPFEKLPYDLNPAKGYLGAFNNEAQKTDYHMTNYYLFERALRFEEIAKNIDKVSLEQARKLQLDTVSVIAKRWVPYIKKACADSRDLGEVLKLLDGWDCTIDINSPSATVFNAFYLKMMKNTLADEVGENLWKEQLSQGYIIYVPDLVLTRIVNQNRHVLFDDVHTADIRETRDDIIRKSMKEAVAELSSKLGENMQKWTWGKVHRMIFKHPLGEKLFFFNLRPIAANGDGFTINAGSWDHKNPFEMEAGGVIRMVVDFSDVENSTIISPPGQSGLYASPHYDDLAKMWAHGKQIPMHFLSAKDLPDVFILKKK